MSVRLIATGTCLVLLLLLALGAYNLITERQTRFFSEVLSSAVVDEDVRVGGRLLHVHTGTVYENNEKVSGALSLKALRLAYEKMLARRNPILSLSGTAPDNLDASIDALEAVRERLAAAQETADARDAVSSGLYPTRFLRAMAETERARLQFLLSGSEEDALAYERAQRDAASAYEKDLRRFETAARHAIPSDARRYYVQGYFIDKNGIMKAVQSIRDGFKQTRRSLRERAYCIRGLVHTCDARDIESPKVPARKELLIPDADIVRAREDIRSLFADVTGDPSVATQQIVAPSESYCSRDMPATPLFVVKPPDDRIVFASDIRFVRSDVRSTIPFFEYMRSLGVSHLISTPFVHYECVDLGHDFGTIYGIRRIAEKASESPLSAYVRGTDGETLKKLERRLAGRVVQETDVREYVETARRAALVPDSDRTLSYEAVEMANWLRDNSYNFDHTIDNIVRTEKANLHAIAKSEVPVDMSADNLFFVRSGFTTLFLVDNPSVAALSQPLFERAHVPLSKQPYTFYSQLPRSASLLKQLLKDIRLYFGTHDYWNEPKP